MFKCCVFFFSRRAGEPSDPGMKPKTYGIFWVLLISDLVFILKWFLVSNPLHTHTCTFLYGYCDWLLEAAGGGGGGREGVHWKASVGGKFFLDMFGHDSDNSCVDMPSCTHVCCACIASSTNMLSSMLHATHVGSYTQLPELNKGSWTKKAPHVCTSWGLMECTYNPIHANMYVVWMYVGGIEIMSTDGVHIHCKLWSV